MKRSKPARARTPLRYRTLAAALALALASTATARSEVRDHELPRYPAPHQPSNIPFTNCDDAGPGSLRDAVAAANDRDFIVYASATACSTITLISGEIPVTVNNLQIFGPGPNGLTVANGAQSRVFRHSGVGFFNLYGMTISGGYASQAAGGKDVRGGCIFSNGTLTLGRNAIFADGYSVIVKDCKAVADEAGSSAKGGGVFAVKGLLLNTSHVINNRAIARPPAFYARGGGVYSRGDFYMQYSEVSGNRAYGGMTISRAGGVDAVGRGESFIYESVIADNQADRWGGAVIGNQNYGFLAIVGSTISGNTSNAEAGVYIYTYSPADFPAHIIASTITANRSVDAAVIAGAVVHGPIEMQSSIVSGNTSAGNPSDLDLVTDAAFGSSNLIGTYTGHSPPSDGLIHSTDPRLGPLANNGGVTPTHALLPDSPAIDAGTHAFSINLYLNYDQRGRGFPRIIGPSADIGAYERDPNVILRNGFD